MTTIDGLFDKYMNELQPLFGEAEIIDQQLPGTALIGVSRFFNMFSLCASGVAEDVDGGIAQAEELLEIAKSLCHEVLAIAYLEQSKAKIRQYGYNVLENADNAQFLPRIKEAQGEASKAILRARQLEQEENKRALKALGISAEAKLSEGEAIDVAHEAGKSHELRAAMERAYDKSKQLYNELADADLKIAYSLDHGEREPKSIRNARFAGQAFTAIGVASVIVYFIRLAAGM